jgi:hypothetical protein
LLTLCLLLLAVPVSAQGDASVLLSTPDASAFPRINAYLDVHDLQGGFVHGLQAEQVRILEDDQTLEVSQLRELRAGVQVVVAINPGPSFAIRNAKAISRYDILKDDLSRWAGGRRGSTIDDWSLVITNGPAISHSPDPAQWLAGLAAEEIDARAAKPSLDILFRAIGLASDPLPRPGMGRAVLFITPPPDGQVDQSVANISAQAKKQGVPIFVWMVSSSGAYATQAVKQLVSLAEETGGKFFTFTGDEDLPSPEEYLEPLRHIYYLEYLSNARAGGVHQVKALVSIETNQAESNTQGYEIDLQPPQPAFVSPPLKLVCGSPKDNNNTLPGSAGALPDSVQNSIDSFLPPQEETLLVVFDFPDGRQRSVARSVLLVDGQMVDENLQPPFDQFTWNLAAYQEDGIHQLQVQVTDVLGLTGASIEIPVQVTVERSFSNPWDAYQKNLPLLAVMIALLAGAALFLVMVLGGRLRPATVRAARARRSSDPITQPIRIQTEPAAHRLSGWTNRLQWPQPHVTPAVRAYLNPISGLIFDQFSERTDPSAHTLIGGSPIPILSGEITIGSDPSQSTLVLDNPCVDGLHARLSQLADGSFRLSDLGSTAGTWVNYTPVSKEGICLEQGDLVHIGRIGFRFTLRQPQPTRKPVVTEQGIAGSDPAATRPIIPRPTLEDNPKDPLA